MLIIVQICHLRYLVELLNSMRTKKFYKAAQDYVQELLENEHIEGLKHFATKALNKALMDGLRGVWEDYLVPKVQSILRLIISRDPVGYSMFGLATIESLMFIAFI